MWPLIDDRPLIDVRPFARLRPFAVLRPLLLTHPLAVLNPMVKQKFGTHPETPVGDLDANTYKNFAIPDDAVIFFFGQDQVIPDNNGPHQISVPRAELASLLA